MTDALLQALRAERSIFPDGSTLVILPHGGRVLGLFSPAGGENLYWTNPGLASEDSARAFLESPAWHNSGGDRTWIAPEVDFFFPNFPDTRAYGPPPQLDPGEYRLFRRAGTTRLVNSCTLALSRRQLQVAIEIEKWWAPAPDPLRSRLDYAGYSQYTRLRIARSEAAPSLALWSLLQLPFGGEFLIPTYCRTEPKLWFGCVAPDECQSEDRLVRFAPRASGIRKIGVRATALPGRAGYLWRSGERCSLVVRNFFVNPSGEYVDVPWDATGRTEPAGYALQACSVDCELGRFVELEYHVPAGDLVDVSQVWAYRGSEPEIHEVAQSLLGSTR